jgi:hypothetical protein
MTKKCKVELVGGLGNQIFGVAMGRYIEQKFDFEVEFLRAPDSQANKSHGETIESLEVFGGVVATRLPGLLERLRLTAAGYGFGKLFLSIHEKYLNFDNFSPRNGMVMRGYFQTLDAFLSLSESEKQLTVSREFSSSIVPSLESLDFSETGACLHMRFGDYKSVRGLGVLQSLYFQTACQELLNQKPSVANFAIFTNSTADAEKVRDSLSSMFPSKNFRIFDPSGSYSAAMSLVTMSRFRSIVMANSSYSFWGALTGGLEKLVIYPEPWFIDPEILVPQRPITWVPSDSYLRDTDSIRALD